MMSGRLSPSVSRICSTVRPRSGLPIDAEPR
jgi:hypothetical protein